MKVIGFETITVANSAIGPTAGTVATSAAGEANYALFGPLETAQVRWTAGSTTPTASVGHLLEVGDVLEFDGDVSSVQFIRTGGTSASLPAEYYQKG